LKDAELVKTPSTVAGVEALLNDEQDGYSSAAIASSVCEHLFDGIQLLQKGVQDETCESLSLLTCSHLVFFPVRSLVRDVAYLPLLMSVFPANFTRFYVLGRSIDGRLPTIPNHRGLYSHPSSQNKGLLRIREPQNHDSSYGPAHTRLQSSNGARGGGLASLLLAMDLQVCRLDRRPILGAKTFAHLYIVEVDDTDQSWDSANSSPITPVSAVAVGLEGCGDTTELQSNKPLVRLEGEAVWALRLREAAERVIEAGGDAEVLGSW